MNEWKNYGDVNFGEYGGVLLRPNLESDHEFEFIQVTETDEDHIKYACSGLIDVNDYQDKKDEILSGFDASSVDNYVFAREIIQYIGGEQLDGRPLIQQSVLNCLDEKTNPCLLLRSELSEALNAIGFEDKDEEFEKYKTSSNEELAADICNYIDIWEDFEFDDPEDCPFDFIAFDEEGEYDDVATEENIVAALDKGGKEIEDICNYLKSSSAEMVPEDGLVQKAEYLLKTLGPRIKNEPRKDLDAER